jgi:hypothetical protein
VSDPKKTWAPTEHDKRFLRSLRILVDECPQCHGEGCFDCHKTGRAVKRAKPTDIDDGA